ncbi:MAG TPA: 5-formyltetrahydrofolate cyclo-ligase [Candidatus Korarchaeota archaeon]|nr:5-formyltetrahydrofolate cyclo-ligase [Candidatus Korarchaeota archaeon]
MRKSEIRDRIWRLLEERGVARFPKPIRGRIPNFVGADRASARLRELKEYKEASIIFCNPDSPQKPVRELALRDGKTLIMATPRLKKGFLLLDPRKIPSSAYSRASTIRGAFEYGKLVGLRDLPSIQLKVMGSVAVSLDGGRIGKGHGYSDIEYAILREVGVISDETPLATTVHDLQVVPHIPIQENDVPIDIIVTPTRVIRCPKRPRPKGVIWSMVSGEMLRSIPILRDLKEGR